MQNIKKKTGNFFMRLTVHDDALYCIIKVQTRNTNQPEERESPESGCKPGSQFSFSFVSNPILSHLSRFPGCVRVSRC